MLLVPYSIVHLLDISGFLVSFEAIVFAYICWFSLGMTISFLLFVLTNDQVLLMFFFSTIPFAFWAQYCLLPQRRPKKAYRDIFRILSTWVLACIRRVGMKRSAGIATPISSLLDLVDKTSPRRAQSPPYSIPLHCVRIRVWQRLYPRQLPAITLPSHHLHQCRYPLVQIMGGVIAKIVLFLQQVSLLADLNLKQRYLNH